MSRADGGFWKKVRQIWQWPLRQIYRLWLGFRNHLLVGTALVLLVLLIGGLLVELSEDEPDIKRLTAYVMLILVSAGVARFGDDLAARLKKVGPVELFSEQVSDLVATLQTLDLGITKEGKAQAGPLSPEEQVKYMEADRYVSQVEFSNVKLEGPSRKRFRDLVLNVALAAMRQEEWWRGRARFRYLLQLEGGETESAEVYYNFGFACLQCALQRPKDGMSDEQRLRDFRIAATHFRQAAKLSPDDHSPSFYLAYALDELGQYGGAIEANENVLKIRPQFAPAKYNWTVSLVKLKRFEEAFDKLRQIDATDDKAEAAIRSGRDDPELSPLRTHETLGEKVVKYLEEWGRRD